MTTTTATQKPGTAGVREPSEDTAEPQAQPTWSLTTTEGVTVTGYLPPWAHHDPSATGIPLERLSRTLADLAHWQFFDGQTMHVHHPAHSDADGAPGESDDILLNGEIVCHPYSDNPAERTPHANIRIIDDFWINNLTPDDLTTLATQLRNQADRIHNEIRPALTTARTDWTTHQPPTTSPGTGRAGVAGD